MLIIKLIQMHPYKYISGTHKPLMFFFYNLHIGCSKVRSSAYATTCRGILAMQIRFVKPFGRGQDKGAENISSKHYLCVPLNVFSTVESDLNSKVL